MPAQKHQPEVISALNAATHTGAMRALGRVESEYDQLIGTVLDSRYRVESKLGEGGMGVVFLARHIVIEKQVAVKVLKREVARDQSVVKRFVREAKAASRIGHPNIVDVTDFGVTPDGLTYSVMEYVDGETLSEIIAQSAPMAPSRVLPIIAQLARALGSAHDKGVVHRDLKPDNIFVVHRDGRRDFVKIVDFGIAKIIPIKGDREVAPKLTLAGSVFGTPEYMAPEQAAGRSDTDHRIDIYSLGVILFEMLVGQVPHKGDTMVRTLAMQMLDPVTPPRELNPNIAITNELEQVLLKALAKKRDERFQSMRDFVTFLELSSGGVTLEQPLTASAKHVRAVAMASATISDMPEAPDGDGASDDTLAPHVNTDGLDTIPETSLTQAPTMVKFTPSAELVAAQQASRQAEAAPVTGPAAGSVTDASLDVAHPADTQPDSTARRRAKHKSKIEPAFVQTDRPPTFDAVYRTGYDLRAQPRPRRWLLALGALGLFLLGGVATAIFVRSDDRKQRPRQAAILPDAGAATGVAVPPEVTDAVGPADAGASVASAPIDAAIPDARRTRSGNRRRPPIVKTPDAAPEPTRYHEVTIYSKPDGGSLYINQTYSGTAKKSGVNLRLKHGTAVTVECRLQGYKSGRVRVVFDGVNDIYQCRMELNDGCVDGIKNPFGNCPK